MKTLNALKLRIMTRAFKIRIAAGEVFEDIAAVPDHGRSGSHQGRIGKISPWLDPMKGRDTYGDQAVQFEE